MRLSPFLAPSPPRRGLQIGCDPRGGGGERVHDRRLVPRVSQTRLGQGYADGSVDFAGFSEDRAREANPIVDRLLPIHREFLKLYTLPFPVQLASVGHGMVGEPVNSMAAEQLLAPFFRLKRRD